MPPVDTPAKPAIEDDYGIMEACKQVFRVPSFTLESGVTLDDVHVNYKTFGVLNAAKDNVLFVCHALTGNAALDTWWGGLLGDGKPFDTSKYLVVCANILGSCYGTTGPTSINPRTGKRYGGSFPDVTVRDTVRLHIRLVVDEIGASEVCLLGLALARQIAMISYRTHDVYTDKFGRHTQVDDDAAGVFTVQSYLDYQGRKFLTRFDANAYIAITKMMDTHDIGRGRGGSCLLRMTWQPAPLTVFLCVGVEAACRQLEALPILIAGIESDLVYPLSEQAQLHAYLPHSVFHSIQSPHGHDGFLLEQDIVGKALTAFLE
ncbi:hypothetical protein DYB28_001207 [Aphanomyces astaci]|uniref:Uncharacterized protein n=1 Tax=Aphanomyces astaci TaxID=112090 RepID=A0A397CM22_APHAT|nr:hypothetical protein DYB25_010521 [Aphanomyces astaci]RHY49132.1 hypothetical protein DYB30_009199 [Aphanomyces astaci]RHY65487.1 hypothetical protein DYB38_008344 [Aphanomyces astaci]RHY69703.1 hypothetical protein DYB34_013013 [Aphanomyces astaci]RHZ05914.1 hypothetical protein DYB31_009129 [Aphanomyces astaci]